jgi:two-component system, LuxR family, sensor kinase FixL
MTHASLFALGLATSALAALFAVIAVRWRLLAQSGRVLEANRRFEATFEQVAVGIAHLDETGRWIRINRRFCEITGYNHDELMRKTVDEITHPEDVARDHAVRGAMVSGALDYAAVEKRYLRKDGQVIWVAVTRSTVRDASGRPEFFVAVVEEITARKNTEIQLTTGEAQYRAIFDSAVEAMAVIDAEGTVQSVNPSVERLFGYAPAELFGKNIKMLMPESIAIYHDGYLQRYRDTGIKSIIGMGREVIGQRKDGTQFPLDLSVAEWERDGIVFFTGVMRDVTDRKRSQSALASSEAHLAVLYAQRGAAVAETDLLRRYVAANDRYCEIVGRSREELLQLRMQDIVHPDDLLATTPLFDRLVATGAPFSVEKRYVKSDGSIAWVMSTASPVKSEGTEPTIVIVAIEITERKEAEAALRASENELRRLQNELAHLARVNDLGEMAAAIAHEINQPLTAIVNYLKTGLYIAREGYSRETFVEAEQVMENAAEQAMRAGDIVRRLREFIGHGQGERTVERAEQLVDSAIALALIDARSSGITVDRRAGAGEAEVEVDAVQIQQVMANLLRNAVEAMGGASCGSAAKLTISTAKTPNAMIEFVVADTGPGIAPELQEQLFEPFVSTKSNGMGMGLSVCRRLIQAHGGTIAAESVSGEGAIFTFKLPEFRPVRS